MTIAWETLDSAQTRDGELTLSRRGKRDFIIKLAGRVLMNSSASRSEVALAERACRAVASRSAPRVLIGGLGMGCTLHAALVALPSGAHVVVAELHPVVAKWCRGPLAEINGDALRDPRVELRIADVAAVIRRCAAAAEPPLDAIVLDLFEGPHAKTDAQGDPFYGERALAETARALAGDGVLAVWSEGPDAGFERRLRRTGFRWERVRPGRGGRRHAVYLARPHRAGH